MVTETQKVLAAMLTENTGRHMLDSGGAYGRHWERNGGLTAEDFAKRPVATWVWRGEYVVLDVFHWLSERVEYAEELDAELERFAEERPDDGWLAIAEEFAEQRWPESSRTTVNTYNSEDSLSQTLQYVHVNYDSSYDGEEYVLLQIHGGCDVRGGYTRPRVFAVTGDEYCMWENNDFAVSCSGLVPAQTETLPGFPDATVEHHAWSVQGSEVSDYDGSYCDWSEVFDAERWDEERETLTCPSCAVRGQVSPLTIHA
jgi:hypothetical protein